MAENTKTLLVYRSALNQDEVNLLRQGTLWRGSLEVYAPLGTGDGNIRELKNLALSTSNVFVLAGEATTDLDKIEEKIRQAQEARDNQEVFPEIKVMKLDPSLYSSYAGDYEIAPGDAMKVVNEGNRFFLIDGSQNSEIFPESETVFFVKHPQVEVKVLFEKNKSGQVCKLSLQVNGNIVVSGSKPGCVDEYQN